MQFLKIYWGRPLARLHQSSSIPLYYVLLNHCFGNNHTKWRQASSFIFWTCFVLIHSDFNMLLHLALSSPIIIHSSCKSEMWDDMEKILNMHLSNSFLLSGDSRKQTLNRQNISVHRNTEKSLGSTIWAMLSKHAGWDKRPVHVYPHHLLLLKCSVCCDIPCHNCCMLNTCNYISFWSTELDCLVSSKLTLPPFTLNMPSSWILASRPVTLLIVWRTYSSSRKFCI